jgi:hypothetical protein
LPVASGRRAHLRRPTLLTRTFSHREIYPLEAGCHQDELLDCMAPPVAGGTPLHLAMDNDELRRPPARCVVAHLLLDHADPNRLAMRLIAERGGR